jgi:hypothetical protein
VAAAAVVNARILGAPGLEEMAAAVPADTTLVLPLMESIRLAAVAAVPADKRMPAVRVVLV